MTTKEEWECVGSSEGEFHNYSKYSFIASHFLSW